MFEIELIATAEQHANVLFSFPLYSSTILIGSQNAQHIFMWSREAAQCNIGLICPETCTVCDPFH